MFLAVAELIALLVARDGSPDPRGRLLRHRHRAAAVQGVRDRDVRRVRQDRAARGPRPRGRSSPRPSPACCSTSGRRSARSRSLVAGALSVAAIVTRAGATPLASCRRRRATAAGSRWSLTLSVSGGSAGRRGRRRRRQRTAAPGGRCRSAERSSGSRAIAAASALIVGVGARVVEATTLLDRRDPEGPEAARAPHDRRRPRGRRARHPGPLAALHPQRRLLPRRHRAHRARGRPGDLAPDDRRHGRPARRAHLRRPRRHGARRVLGHPHVRVERGRRRAARHREVAGRAGARGAAAGRCRTAGADMVLSRSVDGFTASTPLESLTDDGLDAILAVGMNGEPLPARARLPGAHGRAGPLRLRLGDEVAHRADGHDVRRRRGVLDPARIQREAPIKFSSRIDTPRAGDRASPRAASIAGVAWAQTVGIERVEVSIDDGDWQAATLSAAVNDDTWVQWFVDWDATPGTHYVTVRATDRDGRAADGGARADRAGRLDRMAAHLASRALIRQAPLSIPAPPRHLLTLCRPRVPCSPRGLKERNARSRSLLRHHR